MSGNDYTVFVQVPDMICLFTQIDVSYNIELNKAYLTQLFQENRSSVLYLGESSNANTSGFETLVYDSLQSKYISTQRPLGFRLLEIAAVQLFGNAKTLSTVVTSTQTEMVNGSLPNQIDALAYATSLSEQFQAILQNDDSIWNQYICTSRYNASVTPPSLNFNQSYVQLRLQWNIFVGGFTDSSIWNLTGFPSQIQTNLSVILTDIYNFNNVVV